MAKDKPPKSESKQPTARQDVDAAIKSGDIPKDMEAGFRAVSRFADAVRKR
jgi:hypothetical protein